jgi:hypothetical protein
MSRSYADAQREALQQALEWAAVETAGGIEIETLAACIDKNPA